LKIAQPANQSGFGFGQAESNRRYVLSKAAPASKRANALPGTAGSPAKKRPASLTIARPGTVDCWQTPAASIAKKHTTL